MSDIVCVNKDETTYLTDDYVLGKNEQALVLDYPMINGERCLITGNGKYTCKKLIELRAINDLLYLQEQLRGITDPLNKLKKILGE